MDDTIISMIRYLSKAKPSEFRGIVLLRLDFNTEDEWRMKASLGTIRRLLKTASKVVIMSHRGRPQGAEKKFSLKNDAKRLSRYLGKKVEFIDHFRFPEIEKQIFFAPPKSVLLLENLRFVKGEEANSRSFAEQLASLGHVYVNDAFAVSHRDDASVDAITRFLPSYAGLELEKELAQLGALQKPKKPLVIVLGGAKAHDKLGVLKYFKTKANWFLLGGGPANTILKMKGVNIQNSVADKDPKDIKALKAVLRHKNIVLPEDYVFHQKKILDLGPKTMAKFESKLKTAKTIIWSGPLGLIEDKRFAKATLRLAKAIARNRKAFTVAGGGETVMFLKKHRLDKKFRFVSTGGGAMVDFLAGEKLPGIAALERGPSQTD